MNVKLLVLQGRPAGKSLLFVPGDYFLGRGPECHVRFNSDWVSRQHCLLRVTSELASLRDLGSRNGTLVNGQLLGGEHSLVEGDQIQIGPVLFQVELEQTVVESPATTPSGAVLRAEDHDSSNQEPHMDSTILRSMPPDAEFPEGPVTP